MGNRSAKQLLEIIYGKGCMFQKARIAERIEKMGGIKTYKVFVEKTRYKLKKVNNLEKTMTYHHLQHKSEGGETSIVNGVVINELAHRYIHSLPRNQEEVINNMLRDYKQELVLKGGIWIPTQTGLSLIQPIQIDMNLNIEDDYIKIPAYKNEVKNNSRAKRKQETKKIIKEALLYIEDNEDEIDDDFEKE